MHGRQVEVDVGEVLGRCWGEEGVRQNNISLEKELTLGQLFAPTRLITDFDQSIP